MKLQRFGSERVGLEITGDPKNKEPEIVTVDFPGGQVEVTRARDGLGADYWVHVKVNHPRNSMRYPDDGYEDGHVTDTRIDIHGKAPMDLVKDKNFYHLAVRVTRK